MNCTRGLLAETGAWALAAVALAAQGGEEAYPAQRRGDKAWVHVWIRNCEFQPRAIAVPIGIPVHFSVTSEDREHTFTIVRSRDRQDALLNIRVPAGRSADGEYTFRSPGEYYIYCTSHEGEAVSGRINAA